MPPIRTLLALLASVASSLVMSQAQAAATLKPYRSDAELGAALDRWQQAAQALGRQRTRAGAAMKLSMAPPAPAAPAAAETSAAPAAPAQDSQAEKQRAEPGAGESITNVQTAGVDEGGIVKRAGDHLIILRRGRLFTVRVGGDQLRPVAMTDAFAPGSDPRGAWYDELLVSGRTVVVVGYSYARGGTEIGLFELGDDGSLDYRATHHLRSFDYYSARNYASRLVGRQLI
ncbi:MAG: beta-propeller domain-containing protein, partial [Rubrivivax sp.]|nr:beta-propeller domain-containing protein [Rubrivivax sp.]